MEASSVLIAMVGGLVLAGVAHYLLTKFSDYYFVIIFGLFLLTVIPHFIN